MIWLIVVLLVLTATKLVLTIQLILVGEFHTYFLYLWLLLGEDGLGPCTLRYLQYLESIIQLLLVETTRLMQAILRKGSGADVETTLDDVLDALWKRLPATAEVALQHLDELAGTDMADVLVCQVGDTEDRTLLDGVLHVGVIDAEVTNLETTLDVFLYDDWFIDLHLLNLEGTADDSDVFVLAIL